LKGWILVCQRKYRRALSVANEAVELDPVDITALNAQANAYTKLGKWKQAEASARRILALDVHDAPALNLLAQALRLQGRGEESREAVDRILALLPNNAFGQMNAGYAAMEVGDHLRANEHFLSSLRMNPHSDLSRQGLLHSLRARVWIYRLHFRYSMFIRRPATFPRFIALVLVVVGMLLLRHLFEWFHPGFGNLFIDLVWFPIIYLNFFSRITGNIFLCFDPVGRRALTRRDKTIAGLFALVLACVLGLAWYSHQRGLFVIMAAFLGTFAYSIYYPQIKDWWQRRKERRLDSGYTASL
jgi:tetratricopeptide (TPR) repeat protein